MLDRDLQQFSAALSCVIPELRDYTGLGEEDSSTGSNTDC